MGYTHYWTRKTEISSEDWTGFREGFERMIDLAGVPLSRFGDEYPTPPEITDDVICFNGVDENAHESFDFARTSAPGKFEFCKTARKPYDVLGVACLIYLGSVIPDAFEINSDGDPDDWQDGLVLAQRTWPGVDLSIPIED